MTVAEAGRVDNIVIHKGILNESLSVGDTVSPIINTNVRQQTGRAHTATHLLQAALRAVLNEDVEQRGSKVSPDSVRFDFSFGRAMTAEEKQAVEDMINKWIAADMPVIGLKMPSGAVAGSEIIIEGVGFEEGCSIILTDADGNERVVEANVVSSGISILLPADLLPGDYVVHLQQGGARWVISSLFSVYAGGARVLKRLDYLTPYTGGAMLRLSWEIDRAEPVTLTLTEYLVEGSEETMQTYDRYECDETGYFALTVEGFESSNDLGVTYIRDANGVVTS
jgi:hypothetical protein